MNRTESIKLRMSIAKNWRYKAKKLGITLQQLADRAGVSRVTISNAINGKSVPNLDTVNKVEEILDLTNKPE